MDPRRTDLKKIYASFSEQTKAHRENRACKKGCAFCCSEAGSIDITTLEGLMIRDALRKFAHPRQKSLLKSIQKEIRNREKGLVVPCPFLMKSSACMIYDARPFSCRQIYSDHVCTGGAPPRVHRHTMELSRQGVRQIQELDPMGYSGHISYILHMLETPAFLDTYLKGDFKPQDIMVFGKTHRIVINRTAGQR